jgi:hypothetical protein
VLCPSFMEILSFMLFGPGYHSPGSILQHFCYAINRYLLDNAPYLFQISDAIYMSRVIIFYAICGRFWFGSEMLVFSDYRLYRMGHLLRLLGRGCHFFVVSCIIFRDKAKGQRRKAKGEYDGYIALVLPAIASEHGRFYLGSRTDAAGVSLPMRFCASISGAKNNL